MSLLYRSNSYFQFQSIKTIIVECNEKSNLDNRRDMNFISLTEFSYLTVFSEDTSVTNEENFQ